MAYLCDLCGNNTGKGRYSVYRYNSIYTNPKNGQKIICDECINKVAELLKR